MTLMENASPTATIEPIDSLPPSPIQTPPNPKSNTTLIIILVILLVAAIGAGSYYFLQYQKLANTPQLLPTPTPPTSSNKPMLKTDITSNWETYTDKSISFKYSSNWNLTAVAGDTLENGETVNTSVTLKKDSANISMLLNLSGIGGRGQDLNGETYTFDNVQIYKYKDFLEFDKSVVIGLTSRLEASLGVLEHKGKTYSIRLTYPQTLNEEQSKALEKEFDQILSTVTFDTDNSRTTKMCGGIAGITCDEGYTCQMTARYPDASGTCVKTSTNNNICPETEWVDCMPSPNEGTKYECTPEYLVWATKNCPNFQGAAL